MDRAAGNFVADGSGTPGVWLKEVRDGAVHSAVLPRVSTIPLLLSRLGLACRLANLKSTTVQAGPLSSLLRPAVATVEDPRLPELRRANPATDDL